MTHNPHPIPRRYLDAPVTAVKDARLRALRDTWSGLCGILALGPSGIGKTLTMALLGSALAKEHNEAWTQWIRADELSRALSVRGGAEDIDQLKAARVLVIDELGYERFPELCLEVIGARHDWNRPTLVTSGLKLDAFLERYGEATARRISETGKGCVLNLWGAK